MAATYATAKRGEDHYNAKLTEVDVQFIRELYEQGQRQVEQARRYCTARALSEKFGVSVSEVERIVRRERWAHV